MSQYILQPSAGTQGNVAMLMLLINYETLVNENIVL